MAYVTPSGGLNLRKMAKPGTVIKVLRKGTEVKILEKTTWLKVETKKGEIGYVSADFVDEDHLEEERPRVPVGVPLEELISVSGECDIKLYKNSHFIGEDLYADTDFFPCLDRLNEFAINCGVSIYVTSSAREPGRNVRGNIVEPARKSNHLIGHALDMNLKSNSGFYHSKMLKNSNFENLPSEIKEFIKMIRMDDTLRWGGDFRQEDPVHIDDNLYHRDPELWDRKLKSRK